MGAFPPGETGDVGEPSDEAGLLLAADADVGGAVPVVEPDPPQALETPRASIVTSRIVTVLELGLDMVSPTKSGRNAVRRRGEGR